MGGDRKGKNGVRMSYCLTQDSTIRQSGILSQTLDSKLSLNKGSLL